MATGRLRSECGLWPRSTCVSQTGSFEQFLWDWRCTARSETDTCRYTVYCLASSTVSFRTVVRLTDRSTRNARVQFGPPVCVAVVCACLYCLSAPHLTTARNCCLPQICAFVHSLSEANDEYLFLRTTFEWLYQVTIVNCTRIGGASNLVYYMFIPSRVPYRA